MPHLLPRFLRLVPLLLAPVLLCHPGPARADETVKVDVCVYGGTSAGVVAAATAARAGKSVLLVEPGRHLGGLSSGGLGETDIGNKMVIGGTSREFYRRAGKAYGRPEAWKFEPHVAEQIFKEFLAENKVRVLFNHRLGAVQKEGRRIKRVVVVNVPTDSANAPVTPPATQPNGSVEISAAVFLDASYEGDLMAGAGVRYAVGREASAQYAEPLNGVRALTPAHQFGVDVDPYLTPGDPAGGLLPYVQGGDGGKPGDGDKCVQSYNFRLCFTQNPANRVPIGPPAGYDPRNYELAGRYVEALAAKGFTPRVSRLPWPGAAPAAPPDADGRPAATALLFKLDVMPGGKTDINNNGAVSTDFIGQNYAYPDGDPATRGRVWHAHLDWIQGLVYFLQTSPRVPPALRDEMKSWGLCKDEFQDTAGWPHQMYVREARRMVGRYVVTQADCVHQRTVEDSVGMAAYNMDSHNCQRLVQASADGKPAVRNEGDVQVSPSGPYPVGYRAITPEARECENLIVPVCLSASHIAYGSIRMEPVFMVLGQSAATAACQAIDDGKSVQEIDVAKLQKTLLAAGQVLEYAPPKKGK